MKRIDVYALSRFLILVALLIGVVYAGSKIDALSKRLEKIETRLGGPEKIGLSLQTCLPAGWAGMIRFDSPQVNLGLFNNYYG